MSPHRHRSRPIWLSLAVVAAVAVAGLGFALLSTGASDEPSPDEMRQISAVIEEWIKADGPPAWPAKKLAPGLALSSDERTRINAVQADALRRLGTAEFAEKAAFNWAGFLEEYREVQGSVFIALEAELIKTEYVGRTAGGDVIVRAAVWCGETEADCVEGTSRLVNVSRLDTTPVDEYILSLSDSGWKLADQRTVVDSADADPSSYGPETPHVQEPSDGEWLVGH